MGWIKLYFFLVPLSLLLPLLVPPLQSYICTIWSRKKIIAASLGRLVPIICSPISQPLFSFSGMMTFSPLARNKKRSRHTIDNIISAILPNDASIIFFLEQTCMPSLASPRLLSQSLDLVLAEKKVVCSRYIHILSSG